MLGGDDMASRNEILFSLFLVVVLAVAGVAYYQWRGNAADAREFARIGRKAESRIADIQWESDAKVICEWACEFNEGLEVHQAATRFGRIGLEWNHLCVCKDRSVKMMPRKGLAK